MRDKWNQIYSAAPFDPTPSHVLSDNHFLLPSKGIALDLACGLGANALYLAQQGLTTHAWDISDLATHKLQQLAEAQALTIKTLNQEISRQSFSANCYDVIVVSRFLDRSICDAIMVSLKSGGLLFYQTYTRKKCFAQGPNNPRYLLAENELLQLFSLLKLVYYRENSGLGTINEGLRNEAQFIGQKLS